MKVNCPTCKKEVEWVEKNTFRPFCSERCQQIDLGAWSSEEYSIPSTGTPDEWEEALQQNDSLGKPSGEQFLQ